MIIFLLINLSRTYCNDETFFLIYSILLVDMLFNLLNGFSVGLDVLLLCEMFRNNFATIHLVAT
jgi:hypothetical protein